jgi:hypothetical protein
MICFGYGVGTTNASAAIALIETSGSGDAYGDLVFGTRNVSTDTAPGIGWRMRSDGQFINATAGAGLSIKTGSNCKMGTGTLASGTATISTTAVTAASLIFLTDTQSGVVNIGILTVSAISAGVSFTVKSSNVLDASTFNWLIMEPS